MESNRDGEEMRQRQGDGKTGKKKNPERTESGRNRVGKEQRREGT
jgi:hypothetical protein